MLTIKRAQIKDAEEITKIKTAAFNKEITHRAGTARINACGDSRLRGLRSRKPIGFRQWVVHKQDMCYTLKQLK